MASVRPNLRLPSQPHDMTASPATDRYQLILLGDTQTRGTAGTRTCDLWSRESNVHSIQQAMEKQFITKQSPRPLKKNCNFHDSVFCKVVRKNCLVEVKISCAADVCKSFSKPNVSVFRGHSVLYNKKLDPFGQSAHSTWQIVLLSDITHAKTVLLLITATAAE